MRRKRSSRSLFARASAAVAGIALMLTTAGAHDPITTKVTWNGEIARIVQARCVRCHAPDGRAPMPLTTWEEARPWAKAIKEEVLTRRMPKWHAARGYGDFSNDPSLSSFEIALIVAWADGGAPKERLRPEQPFDPESPSAEKSRSKASSHREAASGTTRTLRCGTQPLSGRLLAIRPHLQKSASAEITATFPDGRREIVAWIRNFDPDFVDTYWLRTPLDLPPRSRLNIVAEGTCSAIVTLSVPKL